MNRDLKFRAWDKENKIMREVWSVTWDFSPKIPTTVACNPVINSQYVLHIFELMQYTGLKDKNNTPIYEGDIIIMPIDKVGSVEWDENFGRWAYRNKSNSLVGFSAAYGVEIIGNIYELHTY